MARFNLKNFIKKNIINGVKNGTFTREKASLLAVDYMSKGYLDENDLAEIDSEIETYMESISTKSDKTETDDKTMPMNM